MVNKSRDGWLLFVFERLLRDIIKKRHFFFVPSYQLVSQTPYFHATRPVATGNVDWPRSIVSDRVDRLVRDVDGLNWHRVILDQVKDQHVALMGTANEDAWPSGRPFDRVEESFVTAVVNERARLKAVKFIIQNGPFWLDIRFKGELLVAGSRA